MAAKKYYAVRKGKEKGIFLSWEECKVSVEGFPGAQYKGFVTLAEAQEYLGEGELRNPAGVRARAESQARAEVQTRTESRARAEVQTRAESRDGAEVQTQTESRARVKGQTLLAYVDGSYQDSLKKYAFGCVFILPDGKIYVEYGNGDNPQSLQHRNVTGEMLGAMYAVKTAMKNGFEELEICYDYEGIEKWVTGAWRSKTELTQKYAQAMRQWGKDIKITFTKVAAHTNVRFNELADQMAKKGLVEADGVPQVKYLEDMTEYGTDTTE